MTGLKWTAQAESQRSNQASSSASTFARSEIGSFSNVNETITTEARFILTVAG
jgi:hypothetical protein